MLIANDDIDLIIATRPLFAETGTAVAGLSHDRLFDLAPHFLPIFPDDLTEQGRTLSATLAVTVSGPRRTWTASARPFTSATIAAVWPRRCVEMS